MTTSAASGDLHEAVRERLEERDAICVVDKEPWPCLFTRRTIEAMKAHHSCHHLCKRGSGCPYTLGPDS